MPEVTKNDKIRYFMHWENQNSWSRADQLPLVLPERQDIMWSNITVIENKLIYFNNGNIIVFLWDLAPFHLSVMTRNASILIYCTFILRAVLLGTFVWISLFASHNINDLIWYNLIQNHSHIVPHHLISHCALQPTFQYNIWVEKKRKCNAINSLYSV